MTMQHRVTPISSLKAHSAELIRLGCHDIAAGRTSPVEGLAEHMRSRG